MDKKACIILNYCDYETVYELVVNIIGYSIIDFIVVVDNNSPDNSYEKLLGLSSEKIHILRSEGNLGYGYGNNIGVKYCLEVLDVHYALVTNPDVLFKESDFNKLYQGLKTGENYIICSPFPITREGADQFLIAWKEPTIYQELMSSVSLYVKLFGRQFAYDNEFLKGFESIDVEIVHGSIFMLDLDKFQEIGFFDDDVFLFHEEQIIFQKARKCGYKTKLLPQVKVLHIHSVSINKSLKKSYKIKKENLISKYKYLKRYKNINPIQSFFILLVFALAMIEVNFVSFYRIISPKKKTR